MRKILILGAGLSTKALISYLLKCCREQNWYIRLGDIDLKNARKKVANHKHGEAFQLDSQDAAQTEKAVSKTDIVVSMLPPGLHNQVVKACLKHNKDLIMASYLADEFKALDLEFRKRDLLLLAEMGLDPGIDHMSAMKVIHRIRQEGGTLTAFETFTGGLLAPGDENNPWRYKFTWNPRNVVLAGQGVVKFLQEGKYKYIPYHNVFRRTEVIRIPGYGYFEGYANRDSLKYLQLYDLENIQTLYRGTLRRPGFCKAWNVFVQLGATDDTFEMENVADMTHRQFINSFLSYNPHDSVELKLAHYLNLELNSEEMYKLEWLGVFDDTPVGLNQGTPAQILEHILRKKWTLAVNEKDMIAMWHKFVYTKNGKTAQMHSSMVVMGEDDGNTAMAKTVGLPIGIAVKLRLTGKVGLKGVYIPIIPEVYLPVLGELEKEGIKFNEAEQENI